MRLLMFLSVVVLLCGCGGGGSSSVDGTPGTALTFTATPTPSPSPTPIPRGRLYLADSHFIVSPTGGAPIPIPNSSGSNVVAFADPSALVAGENAPVMQLENPGQTEPLELPFQIVVDPVTDRGFVSNGSSDGAHGTVIVIDGMSQLSGVRPVPVAGTIPGFTVPVGLAENPLNGALFVGDKGTAGQDDGRILVFANANAAIPATPSAVVPTGALIPTGGTKPSGMAFDATAGLLFVGLTNGQGPNAAQQGFAIFRQGALSAAQATVVTIDGGGTFATVTGVAYDVAHDRLFVSQLGTNRPPANIPGPGRILVYANASTLAPGAVPSGSIALSSNVGNMSYDAVHSQLYAGGNVINGQTVTGLVIAFDVPADQPLPGGPSRVITSTAQSQRITTGVFFDPAH